MAVLLKTLVVFAHNNGALPMGGLCIDARGFLLGTTHNGGTDELGTVFEIIPKGITNALATLLNFTGGNGFYPSGSLIADASGNLFGTTTRGGPAGAGTAFELVNNRGRFTHNILATFGGPNSFPTGSLLADAQGNLFGTTTGGGFGTVFVLVNNGGSYTQKTLIRFTGNSGAYPGAAPSDSLIADANGNLFGTTYEGGANGLGTVFEIAPRGTSHVLTTLVSFTGTAGANPGQHPLGGLIADANGNLFGTTAGGGANGAGTMFELVRNGSSYTQKTLVNFAGTNGSGPTGSLIADAKGNLFGTTRQGGVGGAGTVFELSKNFGSYTLKTLVSFPHSYGSGPTGSLIADAKGNLFGTSMTGGAQAAGTVFEILGSGFAIN